VSIHLKTRIESETLHLPELRRFLGKTVEIVISESEESEGGKWATLRNAAGKDLIDPDVASQYRDFDRQSQRRPS